MDLLPLTIEHIIITGIGVILAMLMGIPAGILIAKKQWLAMPVLTIADMIQTVPSLALLALLMVVFGLGNTTVIIGLALYSLLPIIRNTYTGIKEVSPAIREASRGMGMSQLQSLRKVEIPMAWPMILSGLKIAFVTALGTAVIGVLIGAGGLGYIIYTGIQSLDWTMILAGTAPIVLLSLLVQFGFIRLQKLSKTHH